jgi:transcriptional regulator with XRE-family HTH domain
MPELNQAIIGKRLYEARKRAGLAQKHGQAVVGLSRPTFINLEKGNRNTSAAEIISLCRIYGCDVSEIMGGTVERLKKNDPMGMIAEVFEWMRKYDRGDVSEGQLSKFLQLDRISTRIALQQVRAMANVICATLNLSVEPILTAKRNAKGKVA